MLLHEIIPLLPGARYDAERLRRVTARELSGVAVDSRQSGPGTVFVSLPERSRSHPFEACAARERGAAVVVRERTDPAGAPPGVLCIEVDDASRALGVLASALRGHPSRRLKVLGIGGDPGWRGRVAGLVASLLVQMGEPSGWMSGRAMAQGDRRWPWDAPGIHAGRLQEAMERQIESGASWCVLELGPGALGLEALHGVEFRMMRDAVPGNPSGLRVNRLSARGTQASWDGPGGVRPLLTPLAGRSQVSALGQALALLSGLGFEPARLASAAAGVAPVPGWMEPVHMGQRFGVLVDGADSPGMLAEALSDARELGHGRLVLVTGPRPGWDEAACEAMAAEAGRGADDVVVTMDDWVEGDWQGRATAFAMRVAAEGGTACCEPDRHRAVARALGMATSGDVVVLAGKGRRPVQVRGLVRIPWDEAGHAREALARMGHVGGSW